MSSKKEKITKPLVIKTKEDFKKIVSKDRLWMWEMFKDETYVYYYLDNMRNPYFTSKDKLKTLEKYYEIIDK